MGGVSSEKSQFLHREEVECLVKNLRTVDTLFIIPEMFLLVEQGDLGEEWIYGVRASSAGWGLAKERRET